MRPFSEGAGPRQAAAADVIPDRDARWLFPDGALSLI
jgi:hypothetical protein